MGGDSLLYLFINHLNGIPPASVPAGCSSSWRCKKQSAKRDWERVCCNDGEWDHPCQRGCSGCDQEASVHFESAFGPEGSIHLGPSSSPNAPTNVVPSDATSPVTSIQEGSPPSPPLIQPIIPVIVPQIPQPGPTTKSPAYPPKTSGWVITKGDQHSILGWMYVILWRRIGALQ
ncbi:hypothetical protein Tco_1569322 [Tanacetum coccineum]